MRIIDRLSVGTGDRFALQGKAQLEAFVDARRLGIEVAPTWNKSNREHTLIGSSPDQTRAEADAAVAALGWKYAYYVDADHIGLKTVDRFLPACDFYTLDVADFIGHSAEAAEIAEFCRRNLSRCGTLEIPGIKQPVQITEEDLRAAATKYLYGMKEAGKIYRHILAHKGEGQWIVEVSVDETDLPQTPKDLLLILVMLSEEGVPAQTIAPKFSGRFNKGVDYVGNLTLIEKELDEDFAIIEYAKKALGFPSSLKLSVHSGSDKFSLYPILNRMIKKYGAGLHLKTAGTNWLEELIGLAESGGEALKIVQEIYSTALPRSEQLIKPYAPVVDIDPAKLPLPADFSKWTAEQVVRALRHDQKDPQYNLHLRQFLHVSFPIAAQLGARYTDAVKANAVATGRNVKFNLLERHLKPLFG